MTRFLSRDTLWKNSTKTAQDLNKTIHKAKNQTMDNNPYLAPTGDYVPEKENFEAPDEVLKHIKYGWIAGIFSASVTLIVSLIAISGHSIIGFSAWQLLDVALIIALTYGIYKKSRACSSAMLIYFVASKILIIAQTGSFSGALFSLIFMTLYAQACHGTYRYHKLKREFLAKNLA